MEDDRNHYLLKPTSTHGVEMNPDVKAVREGLGKHGDGDPWHTLLSRILDHYEAMENALELIVERLSQIPAMRQSEELFTARETLRKVRGE
jgi:hypothetical protein